MHDRIATAFEIVLKFNISINRGALSPAAKRRCVNGRRRSIRNDGIAEVLAVLLLDAGYVDDAGFGVWRVRIERRIVSDRIGFIDLAFELLVETFERVVITAFDVGAIFPIATPFGIGVIATLRRGWVDGNIR